MDAIEKLREFAGTPDCGFWSSEMNRIADEIERELADKYLLLPVDKDGEPIRIGDLIEYRAPDEAHAVHAQGVYVYRDGPLEGEMVVVNERLGLWQADMCRHVRPDPLEELLRDFARKCAKGSLVYTDEDVTECAAKARELMGAGA